MKKINLSFIILCVAILSGAVSAQIETRKLEAANSLPTFNREFTPVMRFGNSEEKTNRSNASARRQTYVRPTKEVRRKRYLSNAFGVPAVIGVTVGATFQQIGNSPSEWGKNAGGFGRRFASGYATNVIRQTISYGMSEAFKLDNRFEPSGDKKFSKRLKHVFLGSYTTRTKNGKRILDFPHFVGTYSAAVIANEAWFPKRFGYKNGLRSGTASLGVRFGVNLFREFVLSK